MSDSDYDAASFTIKPIFSPERATAEYEQLEPELATMPTIKTEPLSDEEQNPPYDPQVNAENNFVDWIIYSSPIKEEPVESFSAEGEPNPFENYEEYEESESEGCVVNFFENIDSSVEGEDVLSEKGDPLSEHSYFRNGCQSQSENQKETCPEVGPDIGAAHPSAASSNGAPESESYFSEIVSFDEVSDSSTSVYDDIVSSFSKTATLAECSSLPRYKPSILRKSKPVKTSRSSSPIEDRSCDDVFSDFSQEPTAVTAEPCSFHITNIKEEVVFSSVDNEIPVEDVPREVSHPQTKWKSGRRRKRRKAISAKLNSQEAASLSINHSQIDYSNQVSGFSTVSVDDFTKELEDEAQKQRFLSSFQLLHKNVSGDLETIHTSKTTSVGGSKNAALRKPIRVPRLGYLFTTFDRSKSVSLARRKPVKRPVSEQMLKMWTEPELEAEIIRARLP